MENGRKGKKTSQGGAVAILLTLAVLMVCSVVFLFLPEGEHSSGGKKLPTQPASSSVTPKPETEEYVAVVLEVEKESKLITVYGVQDERKRNLVYTGASTFYNGYGTQLTAGQLEAGGLYVFTIHKEESYVLVGKEAIDRSEQKEENGIWEKTGVDSMTITGEKIAFRNQNYRYGENVCVMSNGKQISISDLNTKTDVLTVRGKGSTIYEIVVTKGHGTIALTNHTDFVGGTITIGSTRIDTVSEEGTYVVREGAYTVTAKKGAYEGTEKIVVTRDGVTEFNLFEYGRGPIKVCDITVSVEPLGATLYVDGVKTPYTDGLQLDYGTYRIEFAEGGYTSYKATLHVDEPTMNLTVYLKENDPTPTPSPTPVPTTPPEVTPEATETPAPSKTPTKTPTKAPTVAPTMAPEQTSVSIREFGGYKLDLESAIYIIEPVGAEVYLDGIYLGIVPVDFEKIIGSYELLIVKKNGTVHKYQCEGKDDGNDSWYSFP